MSHPMSRPRSAALRSLVGAFLLFALPSAASAVGHEVRILMDLDNDSATGCLVNTVDGPFDGVEQILITTVETSSPPDAGVVTDVALSDCDDPMADTFTAPSSFDGGWPVGIDNGVGGRDVVETYYPLVASVVDPLLTVRLGVVVTDDNGGEQALLTTDDSADGPPILLTFSALIDPAEIPTLAEWGLILLALLLAGLAVKLLGRRGSLAMVAILALTAAGVAWAAVNLDGLTDEWSPGDQLGSNGIVLFGRAEGDNICFRVDVDLVFNSGPVAVDDTDTTDEDTVLNVGAPGVLANDSDPDSDPLTVTDHDPTSAQGAVVNVNADGSFTYDPTGAAALQALDTGESVDDTFSYTASDGSATDTATVTITVSGVNDAPTAMPDNYETDEDTALVIGAPGVLVNDDDVDGDALTAVLDTGVSNGTLMLNADGSFTYTPDLNFNGNDSFTYHANDGDANSGTVTVTIVVGPVNDGPNAVDDSFMTDEDTVLNEAAPGVLANDTDPEGDPLTVTASDATSTMGATVTVNADGSFTYDPTGSAALQALDSGEMADDTFTYTIDDGSMNPDTATVTVTVTGVNDAPVAADDAYMTDEDTALNVAAPGVLTNDTDVDVEALTASLVAGPSNAASFTLNADGSFDYTPALNFNGMDSFTYRANDGTVDSNLATVTITVNAVNDPPMAVDDSVAAVCNLEHVVETDPGQTAAGSAPVFRTIADNVLADDSDPVEGDAISIVSAAAGMDVDSTGPEYTVTTTQGGTVTLHPDGSFVYTPQGGDRNVADTFTYTIQDAGGGQDTATVTLNVADVCVWFVDNTNNSGAEDTGTGTSSDPFTSLVDEIGPDSDPDDAEDASQSGDVVYVFEGNSNGVDPYDGGYVTEANETILGEGVDLIVDLGSGPETLFDSTTNNKPLVVGGASPGFTTTDATDVEIAGFTVTSDAPAVLLSRTAAGTTTYDLHDNTLDAGSQGFQADASAGSLVLSVDDNTDIVSDATAGILLNASGGGTVTVTSLCGNTVHGDNANIGIQANGVVFDADPGTGAFEEVECTDGTTIGSSGNRVGGSGVVFNSVTGDLDLGPLSAFVGVAGGLDEAALMVTGNGVFNAVAGTGFQLTTDSGTLSSIDGPAMVVSDTSFESVVLTSVVSQNSGTVGVGLTGVSGGFTVTGMSPITSPTGDGVAVTDSSVNVAFNGFLTITSAGGEGVSLDDLTGSFSAAVGSLITGAAGDAFNSLSGEGNITWAGTIVNAANNSVDIRDHGSAGAATTVTFSGAVVDTGAGIFLDNNDQGMGTTVSFIGGLDLDTGANPAFTATNGGTVNVTSGGISTTADTTTGTLVNIANTTIGASGVTFDSTGKTGGANGILLTNVGAGTFVSDAGSITNQTSRAVDVDGGSGNVTIDNTLSTTAAGRSVEVTNHTGGTVDFNGPITDIGLGIHLNNNTGAILRFDGGLSVDIAGTEEGFNATGGGTVHVTGTNTVDTVDGTGIAVNIADTTIGSDDVTFRSVSANGAPSGIVLDTTGTSGGLVVTGTGAAGSGGTIQNTTSDGVRLITSDDASLSFMNINASGGNGIFGTDVEGFELRDASLLNNGNAVDEGGIRFADTNPVNPTMNGLVGTAIFDNVVVDYPASGLFGEHHVEIFNISGSLDLTVTGSTFQNTKNSTAIGADGFLMEMRSTATASIDMMGNAFDNNFTDSVQLLAIDSSSIQAQIGAAGAGNGNTFTDSERGVSLSNATNGDMRFEVVNNDVTGHNGHSLLLVSVTTTTAAAELKGTVSGNRIGTSGVANSGSASGHGIQLDLRGNVDSHISVDNNIIRETNLRGINYDARLGAGDLEAEIINNNIDDAFDGVEMRTRDGHNLCTIISNNTVTNITGNDAYHIRETDPTHNVETAEASATAQVTNNNTGTPVTVEAGVGTVAVGTCDLTGTDLP